MYLLLLVRTAKVVKKKDFFFDFKIKMDILVRF